MASFGEALVGAFNQTYGTITRGMLQSAQAAKMWDDLQAQQQYRADAAESDRVNLGGGDAGQRAAAGGAGLAESTGVGMAQGAGQQPIPEPPPAPPSGSGGSGGAGGGGARGSASARPGAAPAAPGTPAAPAAPATASGWQTETPFPEGDAARLEPLPHGRGYQTRTEAEEMETAQGRAYRVPSLESSLIQGGFARGAGSAERSAPPVRSPITGRADAAADRFGRRGALPGFYPDPAASAPSGSGYAVTAPAPARPPPSQGRPLRSEIRNGRRVNVDARTGEVVE